MYRNSYKCLFWFWVQKANINIYKLNTLSLSLSGYFSFKWQKQRHNEERETTHLGIIKPQTQLLCHSTKAQRVPRGHNISTLF